MATSLPFQGQGYRWWSRGAIVSVPTVLYTLSVAATIAGYYGYWLAWLVKVYYFGWAAALLIAISLTVAFKRDTKGLFKSFSLLLLWEAYLAASILWAPDRESSLYFLGIRVLFPIAFVLGYIWLRNVQTWQLSSFFPLTALIQVPIIIWTLITIGKLYNEELGAFRTGLAQIMLFALPFLIWRAKTRPTPFRYLWIGVVMLLLVGSGSRTGPVLGLIVLVGTVVALQERHKLRTLVRASAGAVLVSLLALGIPQLRKGMLDAGDRLRTGTAWSWNAWTKEDYYRGPAGEEPEDRDRRLQVLVSLKAFAENPVTGAGYYSTFFLTKELTGTAIGAHGIITLLLGETGLIGTTIFVSLIVVYFRRVGRAVRRAKTREGKMFWETCRWTMIAMLLFGLFHQVDQSANFYVLLSWGFAAKYSATQV